MLWPGSMRLPLPPAAASLPLAAGRAARTVSTRAIRRGIVGFHDQACPLAVEYSLHPVQVAGLEHLFQAAEAALGPAPTRRDERLAVPAGPAARGDRSGDVRLVEVGLSDIGHLVGQPHILALGRGVSGGLLE